MPRWTEACKELHSHFLDSGDREIVDELIVSTDTPRCQKWVETIKLLTSKNQAVKHPRYYEISQESTIRNPEQKKILPQQRDQTHTTKIKRNLKALE